MLLANNMEDNVEIIRNELPDKVTLFALFGGQAYYPGGGWHDFRGKFLDIESAKLSISPEWDWWHIVDLLAAEPECWEGASCYCSGKPPDKYLW